MAKKMAKGGLTTSMMGKGRVPAIASLAKSGSKAAKPSAPKPFAKGGKVKKGC